MNLTPAASEPFEIMHIVTFRVEKEKFLTMLDAFSKYGTVYKLESKMPIEIQTDS